MVPPRSIKIEKIFQEFMSIKKPMYSFYNETWQPPTDVYETENEIVIKMSISGVNPQDVSIVLEGDTLIISGKRLDSSSDKKTCFHLMEIRYGYFERSLVLPKYIDENKIEASYKDGFLQINIPKTPEPQTLAKSIKISI